MSENDFRTLNSLRIYLQRNIWDRVPILRLDLTKFSWYQKWFQPLETGMERCYCSSHNGIVCGDTDFFANPDNNSHAASVLLLRDSYRPELSLSRETVQGLPLEAAIECDLIRKRLKREGFALVLSHSQRMKYRYVPEKQYRILLQKHPEWEEQLLLDTEQGSLTVQELSDRIKTGKGRMLIHDGRQRFFGTVDTVVFGADNYLYVQLSFACLNTRFRLSLYRDQEGYSILVRGVHPQRTDDSGAFFPPGLFLPAEDGDPSILANSSTKTRYACNSLHRLSRFLLERAALLNSRSPGSLRRILFALAQDQAKCIEQVNEQLRLLQSIPDNPLQVTDELFLTASDFF